MGGGHMGEAERGWAGLGLGRGTAMDNQVENTFTSKRMHQAEALRNLRHRQSIQTKMGSEQRPTQKLRLRQRPRPRRSSGALRMEHTHNLKHQGTETKTLHIGHQPRLRLLLR